MRSLLLLVPLACLTLSCVKGEAIPQCAGTAPPKVEASCLARQDAKLFREDIARVVQPAAGSTRVRVDVPEAGGPMALCAGRPATRSNWRDRVSVAAASQQLPELGEAPACMAGHSFEVNQFVARRAVIRQEIRSCELQAERNRRAGIGHSGHDIQTCIDDLERDADELWFFSDGSRTPMPFMRARADASRQTAVLKCEGSPPSVKGAALLRCLASEGWIPYQ